MRRKTMTSPAETRVPGGGRLSPTPRPRTLPSRRSIAAIVSAVTVFAGLGVVAPPGASAGTGIVKGVVNADGGVYWRSAPDWSAAIQNPGHGVYNGDQVELECWVRGGTVPPYNNNPLWYDARVVSGRGIGEGLVNDHFIDTGINQPNIIVGGVPQCGSTATPPPPPPPPDPNAFYNRSAAVAWATAHAEDDQFNGDECTWFVSQALWAGGFPMTPVWTSQGSHHHLPGSETAWVVGELK